MGLFDIFKGKDESGWDGGDEPIIRVGRPHEPREGTEGREGSMLNVKTTTELQVMIVKMENFADCSEVADHLLERTSVVLNLENSKQEVHRRIIDFLSGIVYAIEGNIKRVATGTYILTPQYVNLEGDTIMDELESSGAFL